MINLWVWLKKFLVAGTHNVIYQRKNSIFLHKQGFSVKAIDSSYYAIAEARNYEPGIDWNVQDIRKFTDNANKYDLIVMTGSLHCLATKDEVIDVVNNMKRITKNGGYHVLSAFNCTKQDLSGHSPDFHPLLLSHDDYLSLYNDWEIIFESNVIQSDVHPNNGIQHKHAITRILAKKVKKEFDYGE